ncbi:sterol-binding protein [Caballeronia choica]|jgi:ubiquinone biosynthesis accessory factor UbiJ|uniref:Ubiquinone biosynthesis accessory factor UbiJ n=1 Tax=Caballeronia choica TaxID=326476 RepID=A0A158FZ19_9BURK|nr:SCP2 sterol-binding domain-containing protein [Caballeronia choica]SAL24903.1 sterol-binding protein [Caballeronia choica]
MTNADESARISASPAVKTASKAFAAAVNHLLARESWARERFKPYAGKTARLACAPFALALVVQPDGLIAATDEAEAQRFDVTVSVPRDALPAFLQGGQAAVMKHVKIEGDAEFATTIAKLAEHLRWEPEEDLARVIGDAPAHRIGAVVRTAHEQALRTGRNLLDAVAEFLLDEQPQLVRRSALDAFNADLSHARDALARVEKRVERIERIAGSEPTAEARGASAFGAAAMSRGTRK